MWPFSPTLRFLLVPDGTVRELFQEACREAETCAGSSAGQDRPMVDGGRRRMDGVSGACVQKKTRVPEIDCSRGSSRPLRAQARLGLLMLSSSSTRRRRRLVVVVVVVVFGWREWHAMCGGRWCNGARLAVTSRLERQGFLGQQPTGTPGWADGSVRLSATCSRTRVSVLAYPTE